MLTMPSFGTHTFHASRRFLRNILSVLFTVLLTAFSTSPVGLVLLDLAFPGNLYVAENALQASEVKTAETDRGASDIFGEELPVFSDSFLNRPVAELKNELRKTEAEIDRYRRSLKGSPSSYRLHYNLGYFLNRKAHLLTRVVLLKKRSDARGLERRNNPPRSIQPVLELAVYHYSQALILKPDFASAHHNLAGVFLELGRLEKSRRHYLQALKVQPEAVASLYNLGMVCRRMGKTEEARRCFQKTLKNKPAHTAAAVQLSLLELDGGEFETARRRFARLAAANPGNAVLQNYLGYAFYKEGQVKKAFVAFRRALLLKPGFENARRNLARLYADSGDIRRAIQEYKALCIARRQTSCNEADRLRLKYHDAIRLYNEGVTYYKLGQSKKARESWERALRQSPNFAGAHYSLGVIAFESGQHSLALKHWQKTVSLNPLDTSALYNLAALLARQKQYTRARQALEDIVLLDPANKKALFKLGEVFERQGEAERALASFRKSCDLRLMKACRRIIKLSD